MSVFKTGPRLLAARLIAQNRARRARRIQVTLGLSALLVFASAWVFRDAVTIALDWLQQQIWMVCLLVAFFTAVLVARHRVLRRIEFAKSWLAAVPVRRSVALGESLRIELTPPILGVAGFAALMIPLGLVSLGAIVVWAWISGAALLGAVLSYLIPGPKWVYPPPGSRYVPKPTAKRGRPILPSLTALAEWPVRQMFARAQPKLIAQSLVPVLLSVGLQTKADGVMVIVGVFAACGALALLIPSTLAVLGSALRWLMPLPLRRFRLLKAMLIRPVGAIVIASAAAGFLLPLMDVPMASAISFASILALVGAAALLLGAWVRQAASK